VTPGLYCPLTTAFHLKHAAKRSLESVTVAAWNPPASGHPDARENTMTEKSIVNKTALLIVIGAISALFLTTIGRFLESIFLAGLFAAVFHPLYRKLCTWLGGMRGVAAMATLVIVLLFILIPLVFLVLTVASQAQVFARNGLPELQGLLADEGALSARLQGLPFYDTLVPYQEFLRERLSSLVNSASGAMLEFMQSATVGTFNVVLTSLIVLYSFFFLLMDGDKLVYRILLYLPLDDDHEQRLLNRFRSVTLATLKGTAVIGFLQGAIAGTALAIAGIPQALLWSVAMMLLSVVPGIGAALIWIPATIYLLANGEYFTAIALAVFCGVLVGSIDNILRPKLVGSDTQLHELMIFFSTLGGLLTFGMSGFIIGPIIAALFVTVWDIYGEEFRAWLPATRFELHDPEHGHIDADDTDVTPNERKQEVTDEVTDVAATDHQPPQQSETKPDPT
jgi:predicted PurR-regulated permease PerM